MSDNKKDVILIVEDDVLTKAFYKAAFRASNAEVEIEIVDTIKVAIQKVNELGDRLRVIIHDGTVLDGEVEDFINKAPKDLKKRIEAGLTEFIIYTARPENKSQTLINFMNENKFCMPGQEPAIFFKPNDTYKVIEKALEFVQTIRQGIDGVKINRMGSEFNVRKK